MGYKKPSSVARGSGDACTNTRAKRLPRRNSGHSLAIAEAQKIVAIWNARQAGGRALWFYPTIGAAIAAGLQCRRLQFLSSNLKDVYFTLTFQNLGIFRLAPIRADTGNSLRRLRAEMYCEELSFQYSAASTGVSAQSGSGDGTQSISLGNREQKVGAQIPVYSQGSTILPRATSPTGRLARSHRVRRFFDCPTRIWQAAPSRKSANFQTLSTI